MPRSRLRGFVSRLNQSFSSIAASRGVVQPKHQWARVALALSLVLAFALLTQSAGAQESSGTIVGTVVDSSGAAVKNATVSVKDVERGTVLTTQTNDTGAYDFPRVPAGHYQVSVTQTGFQTPQEKVEVALNQVARLDFQLKVGQTSETVEVSAIAPLLETDTTLLGNVLDAKAAQDVPLPTGNTNQLTLIAAPGVVTTNPFAFQAAQNTFGTGRPYINGAREQENNFILDGLDNNQPDNNDVAYVPSPDAIQEFNLITGNAPADFGSYLGGIINQTIKSGTNQFHGTAFEFMRRSGWDANSFLNNLNGIPRPSLKYDRFGGSVGGPIQKDKLFFFADFEAAPFSVPSSVSPFNSLPAAQRTGDFSALCTAGFNGSGICANPAQQLFDPASSANPAARTAFPFNKVPIRSAAAQALLSSSLFPSAQVVNNIGGFNTHSYQGDLKIDYFLSDKDHIMGRYSQQGVTATSTNSLQILGDNTRTFPLTSFVADETHTFSPSLLNDVRIGYQYFPVTEQITNPTGQNLPATFGIPGVSVNILPAIIFAANGLAPGELTPGTIGNNDLVESFHDTTLQFSDTLTWSHGRHVVHAGFEAYHYILNDLYPGNAGLAGQFSFSGQFTGNGGSSVGSSAADFLLGLPTDVQEGNGGGGNKYLRNSLFGIFGQDNWRIKDNLTLNLGLRYELTTARATNNGQDVNYNLVSGVPQIGTAYSNYAGIDNFQPRLGLAWQPKWNWARNTVVRAAYGISTFMDANGINNLPYQNPPFVTAHDANFTGLAEPGSTLDQGFNNFPAANCTAAALQAFSPTCLSGVQIHITNPNLQPAVDQQWNFSIQRQFGTKTSLQVGYVGNKIDHMSDLLLLNQLVLNSNSTVSPGPFAQSIINCNPNGSPDLCGGASPQVRLNTDSAIQRYNALQIALTQRDWRGLSFQANYTWSKCLSNSLGYFGQFGDEEVGLVPGAGLSQTNGGYFFFQNSYNPLADYGRCIEDVASLFSGYLLYDLPFGKGKMFGNNASPVVNALLGGWSLASDFTFHSGFAINPSAPDVSGTKSSGFASRPDCVAGVPQSGSGGFVGPLGSQGIQFLNPAAVAVPAAGTFGNCGVGSFRGPGLSTSDLSIIKYLNFTERTKLQLQAQFINVTNTAAFAAPGAGAGASFGVITSSYPGREIQLGARFIF